MTLDPAPDSAAARVLVVGDAAADRDALGRHVQADGHVVDTAGNSGEAFAKLRTGRFDLVLLDVRRPGVDGPQFLQALRSDAALAHLPVVVVSPAQGSRPGTWSMSAAGVTLPRMVGGRARSR